MDANTATNAIDAILERMHEPGRVETIEPYRAFVIDEVNGRRIASITNTFHGLTVNLSQPVADPARLLPELAANINADASITGSSIYLARRAYRMPYTAPTPRGKQCSSQWT